MKEVRKVQKLEINDSTRKKLTTVICIFSLRLTSSTPQELINNNWVQTNEINLNYGIDSVIDVIIVSERYQ